MKRLFITYLLLATSLLANAQFSGKGSGTAEDPYQISTPIHVDEIRNLTGVKDVCLVLTGDIDMSDYITENYGDAGWYPIPNFQGNLNGCGYTISGLRINRPTLDMVGFFSTMNNATIRNIILEYNGDIISGNNETGKSIYTYTGAFTAKAENCEISRCGTIAKKIITSINGGYCYTGGFVGSISSGVIKECSCVFQELSALSSYMHMYTGGLLGYAFASTIIDNRVTGNIKGRTHCCGVSSYLVSESKVERCLFEGRVRGYCFDDYDQSFNSHNYIGRFSGLNTEGYNSSTAANVIIADTISSEGNKSRDNYGTLICRVGVCGASINSQFTNRASVTTKLIAEGKELTIEDNISNGLSTGHSMLKQKSLYANMGWDMENVWSIDNGNSYPRLKWEVEKGLVKPILTIYNGKDEINEGDIIQFNAEKKTANLPGGITYTYYQCDTDDPTIKNTSKQQQEVTVTVTSSDYKHLNWSGINETVADMSAIEETRKVILESDNSLPLKLHATFADGDFTTYTANVTVSCKDYTKSFTIEFVNENPNKPVCPTPTITYSDGELSFGCDCEGEPLYHVSTTSPDVKDVELTGNKLSLERTYNIEVYATASSYVPSDTARLTICWLDMETEDEDGIVEIKSIPVQVSFADGSLQIKNVPKNAKIELYDLSGILLKSMTANISTIVIDVPQVNDYLIIKVNNKSFKFKM